ncbi:hypothetical protein [Carboxydothermus ferrireducens]|nr:hypothetical protein [Carboxydothermus ferrireducens]
MEVICLNNPYIFLAILGGLLVTGVVVMFFLLKANPATGKAEKGRYESQEKKRSNQKQAHPQEIIPLQEIKDGAYKAYGRYYLICRVEGTNFSVMSDAETNARENAIIDILNRIDFPVQFITTTAVADTSMIANQMRERAESLPDDSKLKNYIELYAREMERMKYAREVLTQVSWLVLSCKDDEEELKRLKDRLGYLVTAFREQAGVVLTPITDFEQIMDNIHEIILPEEINRPSRLAVMGATEPVHFNAREAEQYLSRAG